jgi:hypothetical protein
MNQRYEAKDFIGRMQSTEKVELFDVLAALPTLSQNGPWLAGGAIRRTLIGQPLESDFDFFFRDEEQFTRFREAIKEQGAVKTKETNHHETYRLDIDEEPRLIQLIKIQYFRNVDDLLDMFDFTITQFAYDGSELICGPYSLWDLARKRLALHKMTYGVSTLRRLLKYTNQGFTACSGVLKAILEAAANNPASINAEVEYVD